eukprot:366462-Chlamydomonas_euryale.AAC.24
MYTRPVSLAMTSPRCNLAGCCWKFDLGREAVPLRVASSVTRTKPVAPANVDKRRCSNHAMSAGCCGQAASLTPSQQCQPQWTSGLAHTEPSRTGHPLTH